jgi:hypothetical protein
MIWTQLNLHTPVPQLPKILNTNFLSFERYIDVFFDGSLGILTVPLETTGRIKGTRGEFVTAVVDNLIVKRQFTNLYDNNTTADYNFYRMYVDPVTIGRDPCTYGIDTSSWKFPYEPAGYKVIDVMKPYYKVSNANPIFLANDNLSQVVGIYFDSSLIGINQLEVLLDPCNNISYIVDASGAGAAYEEFIAIAYDPSWGTTWTQYKYSVEASGTGGGGGGTGIVGPGTINHIPRFTATTTVRDSSLYMDGDELIARDIQINNALRDSSDNILIGYGSPLQINDPLAVRDVCIYGPNAWIEGLLITQDISTTGNIYVNGSIILNGQEVGPAIFDPTAPDSLSMPYTVGGIPAGTTVGDLRGKTIEQIFMDLLFPTVYASVSTPKSLSYSGLLSTYAEPSASYTPTLVAAFNPGAIQNGNGTPGPNLTGDAYYYTFKLPGGTIEAEGSWTLNSSTHVFTTPILIGNVGATYTWSVDVSHAIGTGTYYDNKGNVGTNLDAQRVAATISQVSGTITSRNKRYWGVSSNSSLTSNEIITLDSSEFSNTYTKTLFYVSPTAEYIYYCYPSSIPGTPVFTVGGLTFTGIHNIGPVSVTNSYGHTENYNVWRTDGLQSGTNISIVIT